MSKSGRQLSTQEQELVINLAPTHSKFAMSKLIGCSYYTVNRFCIKRGINTKPKDITTAEKQMIFDMTLNQGLSPYSIADKLNRHPATIVKHLMKVES